MRRKPMTKKRNSDTFLEISNKDVYDTMERRFAALNQKLDDFCKANDKGHDAIITRQDHTNGKVKLAHWISTTALALVTTLIFLLMSGIIK
jgi:hypothetical protein